MLNQFSRTELLLGHDNMEKLKNARVDLQLKPWQEAASAHWI